MDVTPALGGDTPLPPELPVWPCPLYSLRSSEGDPQDPGPLQAPHTCPLCGSRLCLAQAWPGVAPSKEWPLWAQVLAGLQCASAPGTTRGWAGSAQSLARLTGTRVTTPS